jgi:hypothetical protein
LNDWPTLHQNLKYLHQRIPNLRMRSLLKKPLQTRRRQMQHQHGSQNHTLNQKPHVVAYNDLVHKTYLFQHGHVSSPTHRRNMKDPKCFDRNHFYFLHHNYICILYFHLPNKVQITQKITLTIGPIYVDSMSLILTFGKKFIKLTAYTTIRIEI